MVPLTAAFATSTAPASSLLFQVFAYCCMLHGTVLADVSWLSAVTTHSLSPLAICCNHSCNPCTVGCTGSVEIPAMKAASACLALLVLVPWWVVHVDERVVVIQSADYGISVGMGQRRSHVVQLLVKIQQLVSKLCNRDRLIYG